MKTIRSLLSTTDPPNLPSHVATTEPSSTAQQPESKPTRKQPSSRGRSRGDSSNLQRGWHMIQKLSYPTNNNVHTTAPIEETLYPLANSEKSSLISYVDCENRCPSKGSESKQCRICHMTTETSRKKIIAPCRCAGTMKYVHTYCLARWLQISASTNFFVPEPKCELCGYKYKTRPFYHIFLHPRMPYLSHTDLVMHVLLFILLSIMIFCGGVAFRYLHLTLYRRHSRRDNRLLLTSNEIAMITAAIFFFISFIMALLTQYRADCTIFRIITRFWSCNKLWIIKDYAVDEDKQCQQNFTNQVV